MTKEILNTKLQSLKTEEYNRPSHTDFMDASELAKIKFTGYRTNSITKDCEVWLMGERKASITVEELRADPLAVQKAVAEVFMIDRVLPDTEQARTYGAFKDKIDNKE